MEYQYSLKSRWKGQERRDPVSKSRDMVRDFQRYRKAVFISSDLHDQTKPATMSTSKAQAGLGARWDSLNPSLTPWV